MAIAEPPRRPTENAPRATDRGVRTTRLVLPIVFLFVLLGVVRIAITFPVTAQGYDEPGHIAAGMEWLDRGTFRIDPQQPPLSAIAIALPL